MCTLLQVNEQVFPHKTEVRSTSEEILLEAEYYMRTLAHNMEHDQEEEPEENYYIDIQLDKLMAFKRLSKLCDNDQNKLKAILSNHGYEFSPDGSSVRYLNEIYHSDYSGLTDERESYHDNGDHSNEPVTQDCNQGGDHSNGYAYIPGQFSDAEDDDSVPCLTFQYGKTSSTMWSYPSHIASDDVDWD